MGAIAVVAAIFWMAPQASAYHSDANCSSCHVPHGAMDDNSVPLWNPAHSETTLTGNYVSHTMQGDTTGGLDGASKLCASCHDGSYDHVSSEHSFGEPLFDDAGNNLRGMGTLEQSHPVSFIWPDDDPELVDPDTLPAEVLDINGKFQCTSCHDIHNTAVGEDQYLRFATYSAGYRGSIAFCRTCHLK